MKLILRLLPDDKPYFFKAEFTFDMKTLSELCRLKTFLEELNGRPEVHIEVED